MRQKKQIPFIWSILLFLLAGTGLLAACSGGDHMLLAEYNRDGEAEIVLAEVGAERSEWQTLVEDVRPALIFEGGLATFIPETNRILLWYVEDDDIRIETMAIGDESLTELFEADTDERLFGRFDVDPFTVYLTETQGFDSYRCYVSQDGAKAARLARGTLCFTTPNGVVQLDFEPDEGTTATLLSLDGEEETVLLDEVEGVGMRVRYNQELTQFIYVAFDRDGAQLFSIRPGDEEAEAVGEAFAEIDRFGFLADGETIYVTGKLDEDDDEIGLFINATDEALIEADDISVLGQQEGIPLFLTESGDKMTVLVYNKEDGSLTEVAEDTSVSLEGFPTAERFLLKTVNDDEMTLLSVPNDGSEVIELLSTDDYDILFTYMNHAANQLLVQLRGDDDTDAVYVTSLTEEDGYFLLEDWSLLTILGATGEQFVFWGREDEDDEQVLYSIPWAEDATEVELDDKADFGYRTAFFTEDGRSLYYTAVDDSLTDFEVRFVPVDGSERPERVYRDFLLLDVSWEGKTNLESIR